MTHKSATIECNPREAHILAHPVRFISVIKLGSGKEERLITEEFPKFTTQERCSYYKRGASVYCVGKAPEGSEVAVLAAVYTVGRTGGWKLAEGFDPALKKPH